MEIPGYFSLTPLCYTYRNKLIVLEAIDNTILFDSAEE